MLKDMKTHCHLKPGQKGTRRLFGEMPLPTQETDNGQIVSKYPNFEEPPWAFIQKLQMRNKSEVLDASDLIYRLHWATRNAELTGKPSSKAGLHSGVVQEWHHSINWVTSYEGLDWDDVTTDT
jgi:hypothetical protein